MDWSLQEEDRFIVVASDGVWEFLSNEQVKLFKLQIVGVLSNVLGHAFCGSFLLKTAARCCL